MVELADAGAVGFTDDGQPVVAPGCCAARSSTAPSRAGRSRSTARSRPSRAAAKCTRAPSQRELGLRRLARRSPRASMVERDLALARYEERRCTCSTSPPASRSRSCAAPRPRASPRRGEVTPHHLCLTDEAVRSLDSNTKMNPPLRAEDDRQALLDALRDGTIAAIATDHAPHARHEKEVPFEAAPFGVTGLETAFAVLYTRLVEPGVLPLEILLERMSAGPGADLRARGAAIAKGAEANLVLCDLGAEWTVEESGFRSKSANSWLLGSGSRGRSSPRWRRCVLWRAGWSSLVT